MYLVVINPWINTYNWLVSGVLVHILIRHLNRFRDPAVPRFVRSAKLWARKLKAKRCTLGGSLRICSSWSFHVWQYLMLVYWRVKKTISFGFFYFLTLITESSGLFSSFLHHPLNFMWAVFKTLYDGHCSLQQLGTKNRLLGATGHQSWEPTRPVGRLRGGTYGTVLWKCCETHIYIYI